MAFKRFELYFQVSATDTSVEDLYGNHVGHAEVTGEFIAFPGGENVPAEYVTITAPNGEQFKGWRHKDPSCTYCICPVAGW